MMLTPDSETYNPDPVYLRELVEKSGLSQRAAARKIGIGGRQMRTYLQLSATDTKAPYPVQFALECLAAHAQDEE